MRGSGVFAALSLGFVVVANLASYGYAEGLVNVFRKDRYELSEVRSYQKQASPSGDSGTRQDAECRIPVNPINLVQFINPGEFLLVFDNEDIADAQYSITVFAMPERDSDPPEITNKPDPPKIYMRVKGYMTEIQFRKAGLLGGAPELSENQYFVDSNGNIAGFFGKSEVKHYRYHEASFGATTDREGDNRRGKRPPLRIYTGEPHYPAKGTIRVVGSGNSQEKYLRIKVSNTMSVKISCLSDTPASFDRNGRALVVIDQREKIIYPNTNNLVYRRRISNTDPDNGQDEGPYEVMAVRGQSYQILIFRGVRPINRHRPEEIRRSPVQQAIAAYESPSRNPESGQHQ